MSYIACSLPGYYCDNCGITVLPDKVSSETFIIICEVYNSMHTSNFSSWVNLLPKTEGLLITLSWIGFEINTLLGYISAECWAEYNTPWKRSVIWGHEAMALRGVMGQLTYIAYSILRHPSRLAEVVVKVQVLGLRNRLCTWQAMG